MAKRSYCYEYARPMVTVDVALFRTRGRTTEVLLVRRKKPPFQGAWVLPGGFIEMDERLEDSARRELQEETGIERLASLWPLGAYGDPGRDPRGRTITVAFVGTVRAADSAPRAGDDAADARWHAVTALPRALGFDHPRILADALHALRKSRRRLSHRRTA